MADRKAEIELKRQKLKELKERNKTRVSFLSFFFLWTLQFCIKLWSVFLWF